MQHSLHTWDLSFPVGRGDVQNQTGNSTDQEAGLPLASHSTRSLSVLTLSQPNFAFAFPFARHYAEHLTCISFLLTIIVPTLHIRKLRPREV